MYLYVAFFKKEALEKGRDFLTGNFLEPIKETFPDFNKLNNVNIEGCIGYILERGSSMEHCYVLDVMNLSVDEKTLSLNFQIKQEMDVTNEFIIKSLYRYAHREGWIGKERGYLPLVCILEKTEFDLIRKGTPNIKKVTNNSAKIEEYKSQNDWLKICEMFEPVEQAQENNELWNNVNDLYNVAFACSKLGEPQNGKEQDRRHLEGVKRYRDLSITFYQRCSELEPNNFQYVSAVAYRYYLNVLELTKPRGRRDSNLIDEINNALHWFDKALELNPKSIKDNYRKGKLVLDKQLVNFTYSSHQWTADWFTELNKVEANGINSLEKVIELYEHFSDEDSKKRYRNEYTKALYSLGCFYVEKPRSHWNEYACYKIMNMHPDISFSREDLQQIANSKELLERCFATETQMRLEEKLDVRKLVKLANEWSISPMDKLYRLGQANLELFFVRNIWNNDIAKCEEYKQNAEKFFLTAREIGNDMRRSGIGRRDDWFISEKLARYFIIADQFDRAIRTVERARASYIMNTYAIGLLLTRSEENVNKAEQVLRLACTDNYNKAKNMSAALLAYIYKLKGDQTELEQLATKEKRLFEGSSGKLISILGVGENLL